MSIEKTHLLNPQIPQTEGMLESIVTNGIALDASPTGTGKTYVAAAVLRALKGMKFVVISPRLNIPKWHAVLALFGLKAQVIVNYEKLVRGNTPMYKYKMRGTAPSGLKWSMVPFFLRGEFKFPKDWLVICDESHRMNGMESLSAGLLYDLKNQGYKVICCSATQAMTPLNMRAFGYATDLHKGMHTFGGRGQNFGMNIFKDFCEDAGAEYTGSFGAMYFDSSKPESIEKLKAVRKILFEDKRIAHRMSRESFGDIFPQNQIECDALDMGENGKKIQAVYDQMHYELMQLEEKTKKYKEHIFAILTKARRHAELLKVPTLHEMAMNLYEEGRSVIVFLNYQDSIDALVGRLAKSVGIDLIGQIHGQQSEKERFSDIDGFQGDRKRFMIGNAQAGAEAIDLQDITGVFPRGILINPSLRATSVIQSAGRPDRAFAKSDILTYYIFADGTIETSVAGRFNDKKGHLDVINDGDLIPDGPGFRLMGQMIYGLSV